MSPGLLQFGHEAGRAYLPDVTTGNSLDADAELKPSLHPASFERIANGTLIAPLRVEQSASPGGRCPNRTQIIGQHDKHITPERSLHLRNRKGRLLMRYHARQQIR